MFQLDNKPLALDTAFTHNGIQYPANWLRLATPEQRAAIGVVEVADPEPYDDRFYWNVDNPKDLDVLKYTWIAQVKDTAGKLLAQTDWMIVRKVERHVLVPTEITTYRDAVVDECARLEVAITDSESVEQLIEAVTTQSWPTNG